MRVWAEFATEKDGTEVRAVEGTIDEVRATITRWAYKYGDAPLRVFDETGEEVDIDDA